uniref:Sodium/calcium exchanger membrane region domain-containing protein n=1 Tax=Panagrolaimus sp. PS1159 TaxID=55785 RepID=A0AC35FNW3_9BILA
MTNLLSSSIPANNNSNEETHHCLPYENSKTVLEACNYVKDFFDQCEGGGYLLWTEYIICTENLTLRIFLLFLSIIYLLFLFLMMTTIADDFFCHSISVIVDHHKISQSIAGVTLMALGNGANDIFSIIASVVNTKHPKAGLAIGDVLGGGAFVTMIVLGTVILVKPFKIAKFATIRDISVYLIGIGWMAFSMLYDRKLYFWEPAAFLLLYLIYVSIIVFQKFIKEFIEKRKSFRNSEEQIIPSVSPVHDANENEDACTNKNEMPVLPFRRAVSLQAKQLSKNIQPNHRKTSSMHRHPPTNIVHFVDTFSHPSGKIDDHNVVITAFAVDVGGNEPPISITNEPITIKRIITDLIEALNPLEKNFSEEKMYSKILQILKFPIIAFVRFTVPQGIIWCKTLSLIHCFTMPLTVLFSLSLLTFNIIPGDPGLWIYAFIPSTIMFLIVSFFTSYNVEPSISGYFGFIVSVSWIYLMSSELVNVVFMLSIVSRLSQEILGLTIMAWSNSIGDFIADTSVARQGFPQMAASAAIGAPLLSKNL